MHGIRSCLKNASHTQRKQRRIYEKAICSCCSLCLHGVPFVRRRCCRTFCRCCWSFRQGRRQGRLQGCQGHSERHRQSRKSSREVPVLTKNKITLRR